MLLKRSKPGGGLLYKDVKGLEWGTINLFLTKALLNKTFLTL
jgi:hypothetical protein